MHDADNAVTSDLDSQGGAPGSSSGASTVQPAVIAGIVVAAAVGVFAVAAVAAAVVSAKKRKKPSSRQSLTVRQDNPVYNPSSGDNPFYVNESRRSL